MIDREAMKLALKTLKSSANWCRLYYGSREVGDAIHALETALAAPDEAEQLRAEIERLTAELEVKYNQGYDAGYDAGAEAWAWRPD